MLTFEHSGRHFAIGLRWYDLLDVTNPRKELARLLLENQQARYGVLSDLNGPDGGVTCVGIVPGDEPIEKGRTYSLAATVAAQETTALVLYPITDELWWGCAVSEHAVMPNGDFYGSAEEVVANAKSLLEIAPNMPVRGVGLEALDYDDFDEKPLEDYISEERQLTPIVSLQGRSVRSMVVPAVVLLVILGAGYWFYQTFIAMPAPVGGGQLTPAQRARLLRRQYLAQVDQRAYKSLPGDSRWVRHIDQQFNNSAYPLFAGGWQLLGAQCNTPAGGCAFIWKAYAPGRLSQLASEVDMPYEAFRLDLKGTTAKVFVPFNKLRRPLSITPAAPTIRQLSKLPAEQYVMDKWTETMRRLALSIPGLKWNGSAATPVGPVRPAPRGLPTALVVGTVAVTGKTRFALYRLLAAADSLNMIPVVYNYALQTGAHAGGWKVEFKYVAKK